MKWRSSHCAIHYVPLLAGNVKILLYSECKIRLDSLGTVAQWVAMRFLQVLIFFHNPKMQLCYLANWQLGKLACVCAQLWSGIMSGVSLVPYSGRWMNVCFST